jgi:hypothetical protein
MKFSFFHQKKKGQAFVEFSISVVVLTIIGFGAVDLARGISTYQRMSSVGREAGRVFLKSSFDTTNLDETALGDEVRAKVYTILKQAMLPDDLEKNGTVLISVGRRIIKPEESESSDATDQIKITHQFLFAGTGDDAPASISRIKDADDDKIISGPPETTSTYPGFVPVTTLRLGEELIIVEIFYHYEFYTPIAKLIPGLELDVLYDRTVF